jgi:hypothetical protein
MERSPPERSEGVARSQASVRARVWEKEKIGDEAESRAQQSRAERAESREREGERGRGRWGQSDFVCVRQKMSDKIEQNYRERLSVQRWASGRGQRWDVMAKLSRF